MAQAHLVRSRLVGLALLGALLTLAGCVDDKKLIAVLEQCPKATARLGSPYKIARPWKIGSPGVPKAPVPYCTHKALVEGPRVTAELWFNEKNPDACFHLYTPTGEKRNVGVGVPLQDIIAVTDVRDCTEGLQ